MTKRIMIGVAIADIVICGALVGIAIKRRNDEEWDEWTPEMRAAIEEAMQAAANKCVGC